MAKEEKAKKTTRTPEQIEAEKAAKVAKKAEMAAKAKAEGVTPAAEAKPAKGAKGKSAAAAESGEAQKFPQGYVPRLRTQYNEKIVPALMSELKIKNKLAVPRITKIVINMGLGKAIAERPRLESAVKELTGIAGQKAVICKAKKSVSNFKLREGMEIGVKVTLRGNRMWEFLDRLITLSLPRVKDFRGLNPKSFDGRGNYNMGITEQTVFPEVNADAVTFHQGMNVTITTTAGKNEPAYALLKQLGMPFRTDDASGRRAS